MLRFIFILISVCIVGFLIVQDTWMVTVQAFGYEVTTSAIVFIIGILFLMYLIHLLKKPFRWISGCQTWLAKRKQSQKEAYLLLALKTVLDKDTAAVKQLLKQKDGFFDKKSDENYILTALFDPSAYAFEQLMHRENTELAGIKGLLSYADEVGDWQEAGRLLQKAAEKHPTEPWIQEALWTVHILQSDWHEALGTLDVLKQQKLVDKAEYVRRKACLLMKLGRVKEAYALDPENPAVAMAYATLEPKKAVDIVQKLWTRMPCQDAFLIYQRLIASEKPAKQVKLVQKLVRSNPEHKLSLLAVAQMAMSQELWSMAKEQLEIYAKTYPITEKVARMMAEVERAGWHHEEAAKKWEEKAMIAPKETGWVCAECGHMTEAWDARCPACNAFGSIRVK